MFEADPRRLAYVIGIAIGDGNLSVASRTVRLRVTCDTKYPQLIAEIVSALQDVFPTNKVSIVKREANCVDVSCHSNGLEKMLGWKASGGPKHVQKIKIPKWIKENTGYTKLCLKGLFQTDGSIYLDRGYKMVNFVTIIPTIADDVVRMITSLGFKPNIQTVKKNDRIRNEKYTIRISKNVEKFIETIELYKR